MQKLVKWAEVTRFFNVRVALYVDLGETKKVLTFSQSTGTEGPVFWSFAGWNCVYFNQGWSKSTVSVMGF